MVIGKLYEEKPLTHKEYKYEGYKESNDGIPGGDVKKGTPNIYYNGSYDTHRINFYYSKIEDEKPPGNAAGIIKIRHMVRTSGAGSYTLAGENSEAVSKLPATKTIQPDISTYGTFQGFNVDYSSYKNTVNSGSFASVSLTTANKTVYVSFFYEKTNNSGKYNADFYINPGTIEFRETFNLIPQISVSGCTYYSHRYRIVRGSSSVVTNPVTDISTTSTFAYDKYPWLIAAGTHQVYIEVTTSCGTSDWVGPKPLVVTSPKNNRPPIFQIGFVYPWAPTLPLQEVLEGEVLDMIYIYDPSVPTPYDPDGDEYFFEGFDFDTTSSSFLKTIPTVYKDNLHIDGYHGITMGNPGIHAISATMRDVFGASSRASTSIRVVPKNPIPRIVAPSEVIVNRPLKLNAIHGQGSTAALNKTIRNYHWTNKQDKYTRLGTEIVELEVTDSAGIRSLLKDKATAAINVVPDKPPVAKLEIPQRILRGPIDILNKSYSPDNDEIIRSELTIWYDADNSGKFNKEPARMTNLQLKGTYKFNPVKVGRYRFQIEVEEDWGLKDKTTYEIEVVNEAPQTSFSLTSDSPEPPEFDIFNINPAAVLFKNDWVGSTIFKGTADKLNEIYLSYDVKTDSIVNRYGKSPYKAPPAGAEIKGETRQISWLAYTGTQFKLPFTLHKGPVGSTKPMYGVFGKVTYKQINANYNFTQTYGQWKDVETYDSFYPVMDAWGGTYQIACKYYREDSDNHYWMCSLQRTDIDGKVSWTYETVKVRTDSSSEIPFKVNYPYYSSQYAAGVEFSEDMKYIGFYERAVNGNPSLKWYDIKTLKPYTGSPLKTAVIRTNREDDLEITNLPNDKKIEKLVIYEDSEVVVKKVYIREKYEWYSGGNTTTVSEMLESQNKWTGTTKTYTVYSNKERSDRWSSSSSGCSVRSGGSDWSKYDRYDVFYATSQDGITYIIDSFNKIHVIDKFGQLIKSVYTFNKYPTAYMNCSSGDRDELEFSVKKYGFGADGEFYALFEEKYTELRWRWEGNATYAYNTPSSYVKETLFSSKGIVEASPNEDELGQVLKKHTSIADSDFTFEFQQSLAVSTHPSGFAFRAQDNKNMYRLELYNNKAELVKLVNGKRTSLGAATISVSGEQFLHLKVSVRRDKIKIRSQGLPLFDVTDKTFKEGSYGYFFNAPGTKFRNLQVSVLIIDPNKIDDVGLVGEELTYTTLFEDAENDDQVPELDEWIYVHSQPNKFLDAKDGLSGRSRYHEKILNEPLAQLDKVGQYTITYSGVDDPTPSGYKYPKSDAFASYMQRSDPYTKTVIIHRKPIAKFTIKQDDNYVLSYTDASYDPDRWLPGGTCSKEATGIDYCKTRGVTQYKWAYSDPDGKSVNGQLRRPTKKGLYTIRLSVKDEYGAWSDWYEQEIWLEAPLPNTPPVPGFTTTPITTYRNTDMLIESSAYDLEDGDRESIEHGWYIKNVTTDGPETYQSNSRTEWIKSFNTIGTFAIRQVVKDSGGLTAELTKQVYIVNRKPRAEIQVPESSDQSKPTRFDVLRPTFEWIFKDADQIDRQAQYQVRIYRYGGYLQLDSGERNGNVFKWTTPSDLPEKVNMYVQVRVHDGIEWGDWSDRKFFFIETNRPPVADFTCTPNPGYEGDTIVCTNRSLDPDGDAMTYQWSVSGPGGYSSSYETEHISIPGSVTENRAGTYIIRLRAVDSKGEPNEQDAVKTVQLLPLSLTAQVLHTPEWEARRVKWNESNPNSQRPADVFWAGEGFVLQAVPTAASSSGGSLTAASSIQAEVARIGSANLSRQSSVWKGYLGEKEASVKLEELKDGSYNFLYTVTYSNGVKKTASVTIRIANSWTEVIQIHRRY
ncbi:PKD domain-containing protein [Paenibacillus pinihumi]|uniref:glycoside hydrolase family 78 protein n=1 Tax=Paenibacillus pinihumi TaxID=669462 RepID=UPI0012B5119B|nr:PKD domain-containing protein [Paenibacillus pinihumi]